jgi:hypothetical protein
MTARDAVAARPYVDRPVQDLDAARAAAARAAGRWSLGPPELIRLGMNAIFRSGRHVLRVGCPTVTSDAPLRLAATLSGHGIAVARPALDDVVVDDGFVVTCWEHLAEIDRPVDWCAVGQMVRRVQQIDRSELPGDYPLPSPRTFPWWDFESMLADLGPEIDPSALAGLQAAVERRPQWWAARRPVVCHGDVHPGNVMMTAAGAVLIDWDLMCTAPSGWDHGPMMRWHERWGGVPGTYERFAAGFGADLRGDPAATLMRVRAATADPAARAEAERRLRYWRGDPDAPMWSAQ